MESSTVYRPIRSIKTFGGHWNTRLETRCEDGDVVNNALDFIHFIDLGVDIKLCYPHLAMFNETISKYYLSTSVAHFVKNLIAKGVVTMDISGMRGEYNDKSHIFLEENIEIKEPFHLFDKWFNEIKTNPLISEPNAMCLSTATKDAIPSARFVLCKGYDKSGFRFFTYYSSRKGQELVRIEGTAERLPLSEGDKYFSGRPHQSKIGALCSDQSKTIESRSVLEKRAEELASTYKEGEVPRPPLWGGYLVRPQSIEFWHGQTDKIHDRIRFRKPQDGELVDEVLVHRGEDGWIYERLAP